MKEDHNKSDVFPAENKTRKLHIGGTKPHPEWEIFNALNEPYVDHLGNAMDLSRFDDNTFDEIYSSHVLEHFDYNKELYFVLKEWHRVLKPGGIMYSSVPDLEKLAYLFLKKDTISLKDRFFVMRMIFGGHADEYDYHKIAFNNEILSAFLNEAGFCNLRVVDKFRIFNDNSTIIFNGVPISLNMIAEKPGLHHPTNNYDSQNKADLKEDHNQSTDDLGQNRRQSLSEQSMALTQMGEVHFNAGKIEDAQAAFNKALEIDPKNMSALNNLGVLSWHKGDVLKAIENFEKVLKLDPNNEDAAHNLQDIHEAQQNSVEQHNTETAGKLDQSDDSCLEINIKGGIQVCVPPSIQFMTPYILIEQEDWFEDEIHYIRKLLQEGMNVIDIGANYGLYTLTMSKLVGPSGKIWAFEPTSLTASFLRKSIRANQMTNIALIQAGLSDKKGAAQISLNPDPEVNAITAEPHSGGKYETVELLSLDECEKSFAWDTIDFIKLDAEGEEHNIVLGGKHFLSTRSPLIMFELIHANTINTELIGDFSKLGYQIYHLIPGLNILAPIDLTKPLDPYQLNLFCCKKDRAQLLQEQGLLITEIPSPNPISDSSAWQQRFQNMPYFKVFMGLWASISQGKNLPGWDHYENALNYYAMAHTENATAHFRYSSLYQAWEKSSKALDLNVNISRLITHIRIQSELGKRGDSLHTVDTILNLMGSDKAVMLSEPFIPVSPRFDNIIPKEMNKWLLASILEYREKASFFSSFYSGSTSLEHLEDMNKLGYQTPEMERRRQLVRMRFGMQSEPISTPLLLRKSQDNINPEFWNTDDISEKPPQNIVTLLGLTLEERIRIVDIGAMDIGAADNPYERLLSSDLACIIGFEPLEQECIKLNESSLKNRKFLPYAVGDGTRKPFYITNTGMTSSLYEPNHALTIKFQNLDELMQVIKTAEMKTVRLDDIPEIIDTDLLKLDVQGAEKMILENAAQVLKNTLVIQTEVEFVPLYKNQPLFADVDRTLREHGFEFHKFIGASGRSFKPLSVKDNINERIGQMLWADAIYVKNFMELDKLSKQKLLRYAIIMHEVFQSFDLCHLVLTEYDRKTGLDISQRYMNLIIEGRIGGV